MVKIKHTRVMVEKDAAAPRNSLITVSIKAFIDATGRCSQTPTYEHAELVCKGGRTLLDAVEEAKLQSLPLPEGELRHALTFFSEAIQTVRKVRIQGNGSQAALQRHRVEHSFPEAMQERQEELRLFLDEGAQAATDYLLAHA
jgi:hypothetical protein